MKKVKVTLKNDDVKEYKAGDFITIKTTSMKSGIILIVCGVILLIVAILYLFMSGRFKGAAAALAVFLIWDGWQQWKVCPAKDNLTLKDGLLKHVGKIPAGDLLDLFIRTRSALITNTFLCDDTGKKISKISNVEEREV